MAIKSGVPIADFFGTVRTNTVQRFVAYPRSQILKYTSRCFIGGRRAIVLFVRPPLNGVDSPARATALY